MALRTWTVREALTFAIGGLTALQADPRLAANEQAIAGELAQADQLALNALRADNTVPAGQRQARYQNILDKVFALEVVDKTHAGEFAVSEIYDLMDLSQDAGTAIRDGVPTFASSVGS